MREGQGYVGVVRDGDEDGDGEHEGWSQDGDGDETGAEVVGDPLPRGIEACAPVRGAQALDESSEAGVEEAAALLHDQEEEGGERRGGDEVADGGHTVNVRGLGLEPFCDQTPLALALGIGLASLRCARRSRSASTSAFTTLPPAHPLPTPPGAVTRACQASNTVLAAPCAGRRPSLPGFGSWLNLNRRHPRRRRPSGVAGPTSLGALRALGAPPAVPRAQGPRRDALRASPATPPPGKTPRRPTTTTTTTPTAGRRRPPAGDPTKTGRQPDPAVPVGCSSTA